MPSITSKKQKANNKNARSQRCMGGFWISNVQVHKYLILGNDEECVYSSMFSDELWQLCFSPPLTWYFILRALIHKKAFKSKRRYCSFWNISPRGRDLYWKSQLLIGALKASAAWLQYSGLFFFSCKGDFTRSYCVKIPSRFQPRKPTLSTSPTLGFGKVITGFNRRHRHQAQTLRLFLH